MDALAVKSLNTGSSSEEKGQVIRRYSSSACTGCSLKSRCTTGKYRRISRSEREDVLDTVAARLAEKVYMMTIRKSTVEHPFGTIKHWIGATHFQMKTIKNVRAEISLDVLAYTVETCDEHHQNKAPDERQSRA